MDRQQLIASTLLVGVVVLGGAALSIWKHGSIEESSIASAQQPEPMKWITTAVARDIEYHQTTMSIGTVLALKSIMLRNEMPGTIKQMNLESGQIAEKGAVLIALDVSVEESELRAQEAQVTLSKIILERRRNLIEDLAASQEEVDRARADLDVAMAQIARTKAIIARKTIRAPFRARIGMTDLHPGQYLPEGTTITTLQSLDEAAHIDFAVPQQISSNLRVGDAVEVFAGSETSPVTARIVALDARIDPSTRSTAVRARIGAASYASVPGSSVRVRVPLGSPSSGIVIPVSALRKGLGGDQVFVIEPDGENRYRAHARQVESGMMLDDQIVVRTGLAAGERVAASGSFKLHDSALVGIRDISASTRGQD